MLAKLAQEPVLMSLSAWRIFVWVPHAIRGILLHTLARGWLYAWINTISFVKEKNNMAVAETITLEQGWCLLWPVKQAALAIPKVIR